MPDYRMGEKPGSFFLDRLQFSSKSAIRQKGKIMQKAFNNKDIEQILAEADKLLQQIDPEIIEYLEEEQRIQLEQQAQSLERLKAEVQKKIGSEGA